MLGILKDEGNVDGRNEKMGKTITFSRMWEAGAWGLFAASDLRRID
jgi:hypothetical protein